ncbi:hypothetical protein GGD81_000511 [Rhodobium orientis]|uniref:AEC family transporter n=1 Tax=Rhodobium orientis TaxID=34017 RepID=A0A327JGC1_9HYPH|nr:AEC family transporter [Rhodobium orientis]MBB4301494.1 hypothetical protein [Rhodobium orientis]MBK5952191.1 AEC family transporter [Rhodobium orientis]RAI25457.1 AEC family transporter [Rhodobium orientis]
MISFADALNALLPVIIMTATGWTLAHYNIVRDEGWRGLETLAYNVFFPAIIIYTLMRADFDTLPFGSLGLALFLTVATMAAILIAVRPLIAGPLKLTGPRFTSVLQGSIRWNTFIGLALGANLFGDAGLALMAVAVVSMIPLLNLIVVSALTVYVDGPAPTVRGFVLNLARNPFIISCAIGIFLNLLDLELPVVAMTTLETLGRSALAASILSIGAGLDLSVLRRPTGALGLGVAARLIGMPLIAALYCTLIGVTGMALAVAIIATSVPAASSSYVLARKMGGDDKLMAEILTFQTVVAAVTLPIALLILV